MDTILDVVEKYGITTDELIQNAECLEEYGEYINIRLMGFSAETLRQAANALEDDGK